VVLGDYKFIYKNDGSVGRDKRPVTLQPAKTLPTAHQPPPVIAEVGNVVVQPTQEFAAVAESGVLIAKNLGGRRVQLKFFEPGKIPIRANIESTASNAKYQSRSS